MYKKTSVLKAVILILIWTGIHSINAQIKFTPSEQEFIKNHPVLRLGYDPDWQPLEWHDTENGISGLSYEYIKIIEQYTGIDIVPVHNESWTDVIQKIKNKELDLLGAVHPNKERQHYLNFSYPYYFSDNIYIYKEGEKEKKTILTSPNIIVGVQRDSYLEDYLKTHFPNIKLFLYTNHLDGISALKKGTINTLIGSKPVLSLTIKNLKITGLKVGNLLEGMSSLNLSIATRKELAPLNSIINKVLLNINEQQKLYFTEKWVNKTNITNLTNSLNAIEKEWLKNNPVVHCHIKDSPPYHMWEDGANGISIEILNSISKKYGFKVEYIYGNTFLESLELMKNGQGIDMVPITDYRPERTEYMDFSSPYIKNSIAIYTQKNSIINSANELEGKKIAVPEYFPSNLFNEIQLKYPSAIFIIKKSRIDCLNELDEGKVDAYFGMHITSEHLIRREKLENVKLAFATEFAPELLRFGVKPNTPELLSILNKGINSISKEELSLISNKYYNDNQESKYTNLKFALIGIVVVLLVFILLTIRLRKQAREIKIYKHIFEASNDGILYKLFKEKTGNANSALFNMLETNKLTDLLTPNKSFLKNQVIYNQIQTNIRNGKSWSGNTAMIGLNKKETPVHLTANPLLNSKGKQIGGVIFHRDISDLKRQHNEIVSAKNRLQKLFDSMPNGFIEVELHYDANNIANDFSINYANNSFFQLTKQPKDIIGQSILSIQPNLDKNKWLFPIVGVAVSGKPLDKELYYETLKKYFRIHAFSNRVGHVAIIFDDITLERNSKTKIETANKQAKKAFKLAKAGLWRTDLVNQPDKIIFDDNKLDLIGIDKKNNFDSKEYFAAKILEYNHDEGPKILEHIRNSVANPSIHEYEFTYKFKHYKTGEMLWLTARATIKRNLQGVAISQQGYTQDITESKNLVNLLAKEKQYSEKLINIMPNGLYIFEIGHSYTMISQAFTKILGYTLKDMQNVDENALLNLVHPEDVSLFHNHMISLMESDENKEFQCTFRAKHKKGHYIWMHETDLPFEYNDDGSIKSVIGSFLEVTEQRKKDQKIIELNNILTVAQSIAKVGNFNWNLITNTIEASKEYFKIIAEDDTNNSYNTIFNNIVPEDKEAFKQCLNTAKINKSNYSYSYRINTNNGIKYINNKGNYIYNEKEKAIALFGTVQDITETALNNQELRDNQTRLQQAVKVANLGTFKRNIHTNEIELNDELEDMLGIPKKSPNMIASLINNVHPKDVELLKQNITDLQLGKIENVSLEFRYKHPKKGEKWLANRTQLLRDNYGNPETSVGIFQDITENKNAQLQIIQQKEFSELLTKISTKYVNANLNNVSNVIYEALDEVALYLNADRAYIFKYNFEKQVCESKYEWTNEGVEKLMEETKEQPFSAMRLSLNKHLKGEVLMLSDVNEVTDVKVKKIFHSIGVKSICTVPMFINDKLIGFFGLDIMNKPHTFKDWELSLFKVLAEIFANISQRIETEQEKQEQYSYLKTLINSIPDLVFAKDTKGVFTMVNPIIEKTTTKKVAEIIGKTDYDLYDKKDADTFVDIDNKVFLNGESTTVEELIPVKNSTKKLVFETTKTPIKNNDGKIIGLIGIGRDVTERNKRITQLKQHSKGLEKIIEVSNEEIETLDTFLISIKKQALEITQSSIGCILLYQEETNSFNSNSSLNLDKQSFKTLNRNANFNFQQTNIFNEIVLSKKPILINNCKETNSFGKNISEGEIPHNFLGVPILSNDKIVAVIAVANKQTDFTTTDKQQLTLLMDNSWQKIERYYSHINLSEAKEKLDFALQSANMGTWSYNYSQDILTLNSFKFKHPIVKQINNGTSLQSFLAILKNGQKEKVTNRLQELIDSKTENFELTFEVENNQQEIKHISTTGKAIFSEDGIPITASGLIWDITEAKEKEIAITKSQENLKKILDSVPIGIAIVNRESGNYLFVNKTLRKMFEIEDNEIRYFNDVSIYKNPDDLKILMEKLNTHQKLKNYELEFVTTKTGKSFWAQANSTRGDFLDMKTNLITMYDITNIKELQLQIKRSNEQIETATKAANIGSWDYRPLTNELFTNDTFKTMLGYPASLPIPDFELWTTLVHPDDKEWVSQELGLYFSNEAIGKYDIQYRMLHKQGHYIWIRDVGEITETNEDGKCARFIGFQIDISSQIKLQEKLKRAKEKAEEANQAKSTFLANMSHEIRTPMNAILGFSEILSKNLTDEAYLNYLQSIKSSGKTLLDIINDILDISKIEAGKISLKKENTNINTLIDEIYNMFEFKAQQNGIEFNKTIANNLPKHVRIDDLRLRQVLLNLISNAFKFTHKGSISIKVICVESKNNSNKLDLSFKISDTGIGILPKDQEHIFNSFEQVEDHDTRKYGGTGLGLSISRKIIELMGGSLTVKSEVGKGSTFTAHIPSICKTNTNAVENLPKLNSYPEQFVFEKSKILIVDDNEENRNVLKGYLNFYDFQLFEAANGKEAVELTISEVPDVILMDLRLPILDGFEAFDIIRKTENTSHIPVFAVTASALKTTDEILEKGFRKHVRKPVVLNDLVNSLAEVIPHSLIENTNNFKTEEQILIPENHTNFNEILAELEQINKNYCQPLIKRINKKNIHFFCEQLEYFNNKYHLNHFINYKNDVQNAFQIFDIEKTKKLVVQFERDLKTIKDKPEYV